MDSPDSRPPAPGPGSPPREGDPAASCRPSCPACGGTLVEIKAKLICSRCRTICETCCEGGPG
ncbi:hypothetical protein AB1L88_11205 [Tautonia sp. JC769]|uniref:hypothetical protein n=1 Tax=Tautonia sp. JC769 TaxID=3232135 RepID=UPI003457FA50